MIRRFSFHNGAMIITVTSIITATICSIIDPQAGRKSPAKFVFPDEIPLPGWNFVSSQKNETKILPTDEAKDIIQDGKDYKFTYKNRSLDIDIFYLSKTRGNIKQLLKEYFNVDEHTLKSIQIKQTNQNHYSLFVNQDRAYLSACINPFGHSTVTQRQFSQNLNNRLLNLRLVGNWLLGRDSIRDRRCLWTIMSIPNHQETSQELNQTLEQTWEDYHRWWQKRFPDLHQETAQKLNQTLEQTYYHRWWQKRVPDSLQETSQELNQTLEQTWKYYHQWWQKRFPELLQETSQDLNQTLEQTWKYYHQWWQKRFPGL